MTATNQPDEPVSMVQSADVANKQQSAGQLLKEARLKAGVHLAVLSVTLKVPVRQLEALESDQIDPAKGAVFLRGLASSVCRHVNTDPAPILALLPQAAGQMEPFRSAVGPSVPERTLSIHSYGWRRFTFSRVFWGSALMLVLIGSLVWLPGPSSWVWLDDAKATLAQLTRSQFSAFSEPAVPAAALVAPAEALMPPSATPTPVPSDGAVIGAPMSPLVSPAAAPVEPVPAVAQTARATAPAIVPPPVLASPPPVAGSQAQEWVFTAKDDSWLEIRNAQKSVVWMGVIKAGEIKRIPSPLPVSVVIGRAQGVTATWRGQAFDLKPHTQATVARFEVKE